MDLKVGGVKSQESVLLAMSGGVDSSAAAFLLRESGFQVVGCTMQLWDYRRDTSPGIEASSFMQGITTERYISHRLNN